MNHDEIFSILESQLLESEKRALAASFLSDVSNDLAKSTFFFNLGERMQKKEYYFIALDYLQNLDDSFDKWLLWGKIFMSLAEHFSQFSLLEEAQMSLQKAFSYLEKDSPKLQWALGKVWSLQGRQSGEESDFLKGLSFFNKAKWAFTGPHLFKFQLDHALALSRYGFFKGDPTLVKQGLEAFQHTLSPVLHSHEELQYLIKRGWKDYAQLACQLYELTHKTADLERADLIARETLVAFPDLVDLWIAWGELFLHSGWVLREFKYVELGIEKLTSSKIRECDPTQVAVSLGRGLAMLGMFQEEHKFIHKGRERILEISKKDPQKSSVFYSLGIVLLIEGMHLSDSYYFEKAIQSFEKGLSIESQSPLLWHGLFQAYLAWGNLEEDYTKIYRAIKFIRRLVQLRPHSFIYAQEHGKALYRLTRYSENRTFSFHQSHLEEAALEFKRSATMEENLDTYYSWACALDALGDITGNASDYEEALVLLDKAAEISSSAPIRFQKAIVFSHLGELTGREEYLAEAIEIFSSLFDFEKENEVFLCEMGYAKLILSELTHPIFDEKKNELNQGAEQALMLSAQLGHLEALYHLACLYSLLGFYEKSALFLRKADENGALPSNQELDQEVWLEGVRESEFYQTFLMTRIHNNKE